MQIRAWVLRPLPRSRVTNLLVHSGHHAQLSLQVVPEWRDVGLGSSQLPGCMAWTYPWSLHFSAVNCLTWLNLPPATATPLAFCIFDFDTSQLPLQLQLQLLLCVVALAPVNMSNCSLFGPSVGLYVGLYVCLPVGWLTVAPCNQWHWAGAFLLNTQRAIVSVKRCGHCKNICIRQIYNVCMYVYINISASVSVSVDINVRMGRSMCSASDVALDSPAASCAKHNMLYNI